MLACNIDYSDLDACVSNANKAKNDLEDCIDFLSKKVMGKLNSLPGTDDQGNIAAIKSGINTRVSDMKVKQQALEEFHNTVEDFVSTAEAADKAVADRISSLAEPYKSPVSFMGAYRAVTGFLYDVFCVDIPGFFADRCPFLDGILEFLRGAANCFSHWTEDIVNFFKHGGGQYFMKTVGAILDMVGACVTVIAAVTAAATAGFMFIAGFALVLGTIFLLYTFANSAVKIMDYTMANEYAIKGRNDLAHYYSGTEDLADWADKKDFGDAQANIRWECAMGVFDEIGKTAEIGITLIELFTGAWSLGNVYKPDGKTWTGTRDYSWDNVKKNLKREYLDIFKKSGVKDDTVKVVNGIITDYELDWGEFLFNSEMRDLDNLAGDDTLKQIKAGKNLFNKLVDRLSGKKSGVAGLAEKLDELYEGDSTTVDTLDVFSEAFSYLDTGPSYMADEHINPVAELIKDIFDLRMSDTESAGILKERKKSLWVWNAGKG